MMDMIERVARAIRLVKSEQEHVRIGAPSPLTFDPSTYYGEVSSLQAREAVRALSTPTPEMIEAGRACYNGMRTPTCEEVFAAMMGAVK